MFYLLALLSYPVGLVVIWCFFQFGVVFSSTNPITLGDYLFVALLAGIFFFVIPGGMKKMKTETDKYNSGLESIYTKKRLEDWAIFQETKKEGTNFFEILGDDHVFEEVDVVGRTSFTEKIERDKIDNYSLPSLTRLINREIADYHFYQMRTPEEREILCNYFFASIDLHNFCPAPYLEKHKLMGRYATEQHINSFSTGKGRLLLSALSEDILFCSRVERSLSELRKIEETPRYYYLVNTFLPSFKQVLLNFNDSRTHLAELDSVLVDQAQLIIARIADELSVQRNDHKNEMTKRLHNHNAKQTRLKQLN